jgi:hypothetical protein
VTPVLRLDASLCRHCELEATDCLGTVRFTDLTHSALAVVECDGCDFETTVRKTDVQREESRA